MNKFFTLSLFLGFAGLCQAQIVEKPLKLEAQFDPEVAPEVNKPAKKTNSDQIIFPPAEEPYVPMPVKAATPPQAMAPVEDVQRKAPVDPTMNSFQRAEQAYKAQNNAQPLYQPQQQVSTYASIGNSTSRDIIERAALNCESELSQLWEQKNSVDPSRRSQYQKCMGEAKVRCDQLKESAQAFKRADQQLSTYQTNLQQAQAAIH